MNDWILDQHTNRRIKKKTKSFILRRALMKRHDRDGWTDTMREMTIVTLINNKIFVESESRQVQARVNKW